MKSKIPFSVNFILSLISVDIMIYHKIVNENILNQPYMIGMIIILGITTLYNLASGLFKYLNNQLPPSVIPISLNLLILILCIGLMLYHFNVNENIMNQPYMIALFIILSSTTFYNIGSISYKYLTNGNKNTTGI